MRGFFKRNCLELQKFLPLTQSPLFFAAEIVESYFLALESWVGGPDVGRGLLAPEISLQSFYPPHMGERPAHFLSACLLPVSMDMVSLSL